MRLARKCDDSQIVGSPSLIIGSIISICSPWCCVFPIGSPRAKAGLRVRSGAEMGGYEKTANFRTGPWGVGTGPWWGPLRDCKLLRSYCRSDEERSASWRGGELGRGGKKAALKAARKGGAGFLRFAQGGTSPRRKEGREEGNPSPPATELRRSHLQRVQSHAASRRRVGRGSVRKSGWRRSWNTFGRRNQAASSAPKGTAALFPSGCVLVTAGWARPLPPAAALPAGTIARIATHPGVRTHARDLEAMPRTSRVTVLGERVYFKGFTLMLLMCTSLPGS